LGKIVTRFAWMAARLMSWWEGGGGGRGDEVRNTERKKEKEKKKKTIPSRGTYCEQEDNEFLRGRLHRLESDYGEP
jgi:hypothetical protein